MGKLSPHVETPDPSLALLWYDQNIYNTGRKILKQRAKHDSLGGSLGLREPKPGVQVFYNSKVC